MLENSKRENGASWTDTLMMVTGIVILVFFVVFVFDFLQKGIMTVLP
jgi:hypothetical protein